MPTTSTRDKSEEQNRKPKRVPIHVAVLVILAVSSSICASAFIIYRLYFIGG